MNVSEIFIRRPIATSLLMAAIALFGVDRLSRAAGQRSAAGRLSRRINVSASLPGGDPDTMASSVATPLERQFTTIAGLDSMTSSQRHRAAPTSRCSSTSSRDIDSATVDVQTAIAAAMPLLPPGMPSPPSFRKQNPADQPILHAQPDVATRCRCRRSTTTPRP